MFIWKLEGRIYGLEKVRHVVSNSTVIARQYKLSWHAATINLNSLRTSAQVV